MRLHPRQVEAHIDNLLKQVKLVFIISKLSYRFRKLITEDWSYELLESPVFLRKSVHKPNENTSSAVPLNLEHSNTACE